MLPSPRPEMSAEPTMNENGRARAAVRLVVTPELLLHAHRHDLIIDELRPHVVVLVQRVVVLRAERQRVGLDESLVAIDLVIAIADRRALSCLGRLAGSRAEHY